MTEYSLLPLDWQLLELLQGDGRMSISELAQRLQRSRSTIGEHLRRLSDQGVITGYSVQVDPARLGFGLQAVVRLDASSSKHRQLVKAVVAMPEVIECLVLTGETLMQLRLVARDMQHLRTLVDQLSRYGATHTDAVFASVKSSLAISHALRKVAEDR